jgi:DNA-binding CsgD family transcriptional regulator
VARILDEIRAPAVRRFGRKNKAAALLTSREWEVMELLSEGQTTDEVARRLFVAPTTVRVHISSVLRKLRVKDRKSAFDLLAGMSGPPRLRLMGGRRSQSLDGCCLCGSVRSGLRRWPGARSCRQHAAARSLSAQAEVQPSRRVFSIGGDSAFVQRDGLLRVVACGPQDREVEQRRLVRRVGFDRCPVLILSEAVVPSASSINAKL